MKLRFIVERLKEFVPSVLGIYRVYDYARQAALDEVFVYLTDEEHYIALKELKTVLVAGKELIFRDGNWYGCSVASGLYLPTASRREIEGLPMSIQLSKLLRIGRHCAGYLLELLSLFENEVGSDFTGLTLIYDSNALLTRPFGFASFANRPAMLRFDRKTMTIRANKFECVASEKMPIIVSMCNKELLAEGRLNADLKMANWLFGHKDELEEENEVEPDLDMEKDLAQSDTESCLSIEFNEEL
jgi:hypothetical protein